MKWGPSVHVLCCGVCSEFLKKNLHDIRMALSGSPMKRRHLEFINIECEIRVRLKKKLTFFLTCFNHREEFLAIVIVKRLLNKTLIFLYFAKTQVVLSHLCCELLDSFAENFLLLSHIFMALKVPFHIFLFRHWVISPFDKAALLKDPFSNSSLLLLRHLERYQPNHFICIWDLFESWRWFGRSRKENLQVSRKWPKIKWFCFSGNMLLIPQKVLIRALLILFIDFFLQSLLDYGLDFEVSRMLDWPSGFIVID